VNLECEHVITLYSSKNIRHSSEGWRPSGCSASVKSPISVGAPPPACLGPLKVGLVGPCLCASPLCIYITNCVSTSPIVYLHHQLCIYITNSLSTSLILYLHHQFFIYITNSLSTSPFAYLHHQLFIYATNSLSTSPFAYLHYQLCIYITICLSTSPIVYLRLLAGYSLSFFPFLLE